MSDDTSKCYEDLKSECPICFKQFRQEVITAHVDRCIELHTFGSSGSTPTGAKTKKLKLDRGAWGCLARSPNTPRESRSPISQSQKATFRPSETHVERRNQFKNSAMDETEKTNASSPASGKNTITTNSTPLAEQMRPDSLETYIGHDDVVGKSTVLRTLLDKNEVPSLILWGPPGCGKTSLVHAIAMNCKEKRSHKFHSLSATSSGVNDVKKIVEQAKSNTRLFKMKTILFIDEIHRFNKLQQDTFLPHIENGTITLIGATTENPSFSLNNALLSRCKVVHLEKLSTKNIKAILQSALLKLGISSVESDFHVESAADISNFLEHSSIEAAVVDKSTTKQNGFPTIWDIRLCGSGVNIEKSALELLTNLSDGDARTALGTLEISYYAKKDSYILENAEKLCGKTESLNSSNESDVSTKLDSESHKKIKVITKDDIKNSLMSSKFYYDRGGDNHYHSVSAFIKSMRGSDPTAALYWMCRMIHGGEDPKFIARRMVIFASEDIGLADAQALSLAVSTFQSCQFIGMPECGIILAECCVYLARAKKSVESYSAYNRALNFVKTFEGPHPTVPLHLRNASTKLMKDMGYGKDYLYPPTSNGASKQMYLPEGLSSLDFFSDHIL